MGLSKSIFLIFFGIVVLGCQKPYVDLYPMDGVGSRGMSRSEVEKKAFRKLSELPQGVSRGVNYIIEFKEPIGKYSKGFQWFALYYDTKWNSLFLETDPGSGWIASWENVGVEDFKQAAANNFDLRDWHKVHPLKHAGSEEFLMLDRY